MTEMARPGNNARSNLDHRQAVTQHDTPHLIQGWRPCDKVGCCEPVARSLGAQQICERHAAVVLVPIVRKQLYDDNHISFDSIVGIGRYESPAPGWQPGWVNLRCDNSLCAYQWVGRYAWFEGCRACLARANRKSRKS